MWSEDINKKIRDADDSNNFPLDENTWEKMEVLLDKHLPQKKKRRGLFIILLSVSLLTIPAVMLLKENEIKKTEIIAYKTKNNYPSSTDHVDKENRANTVVRDEIRNPNESETPNSSYKTETFNKSVLNKNPEPSETDTNGNDKKINKVFGITDSQPKTQIVLDKSKKKVFSLNHDQLYSKENLVTSRPNKSGNESTTSTPTKTQSGPVSSETSQNKLQTTDNTTSKISDSIALTKTVDKKKSSSISAQRKFSINFAIGPDVSGVMHSKAGKVEMKYGLGLRYEVSKKIAVRTGFFVSKKIYSADSAAYHPDPVFWNYYTNLQKVAANCLVYEIPVNISYTFLSKQKNSGFVATGLSSYLMKKETYEYSYKNAWGGPETHTSVYNSKNEHLFSVLNLSAGLRHEFNGRLSLIVEPYAQLPVKGVGAGKVKLNSAGVLFTVDYKPYRKK